MPKKCEGCQFFFNDPAQGFHEGICVNETIAAVVSGGICDVIDIDSARHVCDREGDGIFVYYEPKTPAAGAAFAGNADALVRNEGNARNAAAGGSQ